MRTVTVRLPDGLHRELKVRLAERGDSFEGVARDAFVAYLDGGLSAGNPTADGGGSPRPASTSPCPGDAPAGTRCKLCGKTH